MSSGDTAQTAIGPPAHPYPELEPPVGEECGVFGVWAPGEEVSRLTYFGLYALLSCTGWGGLCFRVGFFVGMVGVGWSFWGTKVAVGSGG